MRRRRAGAARLLGPAGLPRRRPQVQRGRDRRARGRRGQRPARVPARARRACAVERRRSGSVAAAVAVRQRRRPPRAPASPTCRATATARASSLSLSVRENVAVRALAPLSRFAASSASARRRPQSQAQRDQRSAIRTPSHRDAGRQPLRRQPAEGRAGARPAGRAAGAARGRADPGRRRRRARSRSTGSCARPRDERHGGGRPVLGRRRARRALRPRAHLLPRPGRAPSCRGDGGHRGAITESRPRSTSSAGARERSAASASRSQLAASCRGDYSPAAILARGGPRALVVHRDRSTTSFLSSVYSRTCCSGDRADLRRPGQLVVMMTGGIDLSVGPLDGLRRRRRLVLRDRGRVGPGRARSASSRCWPRGGRRRWSTASSLRASIAGDRDAGHVHRLQGVSLVLRRHARRRDRRGRHRRDRPDVGSRRLPRRDRRWRWRSSTRCGARAGASSCGAVGSRPGRGARARRARRADVRARVRDCSLLTLPAG